MRQSIYKNKRGISAWISWVLLVAFMVSLSTIMYQFLSSFAKSSVDDLKTRVVDTKACDNVGISANVCIKDSNTLEITTRNVNYITIEKLSIDLFDVFDRPAQKSKTLKLPSGSKRTFEILKDGVIKEAHIVPVIYKSDNVIYCSNKEVVITEVEDC